MPVYCFVIGCRNGPKGSRKNMEHSVGGVGVGGGATCGATVNENKVRYFRTPKADVLLKQWALKLPKKPDKTLNASCRVCENHFLEQDIIKNDKLIIGGKVVGVPRPIWTLKPGAIPSIFEDVSASNLMPAETQKRKPPVERKPLGNITNYKKHCPSHLHPKKRNQPKNSKIELEYQIPQEELPPSLMEDIAVVTSDIEQQSIPMEPTTVTPNIERERILQSDILQIKIPEPSWYREQVPGDSACVNYFQVVVQKCSVAIQKMATVDFQKMTIRQTIISRELTEIEESHRSFRTLQEVEEMLKKLNEAKICPGIINNPLKHRQDGKTFVNNGKFTDGVWRANKCSLLLPSTDETKPCKFCKLVDKALKLQFKRHITIQIHTALNHKYLSRQQLSRKVSAKVKKVSKLKIQLEKKIVALKEMTVEIRALRENIASLKNAELDLLIKELDDKV